MYFRCEWVVSPLQRETILEVFVSRAAVDIDLFGGEANRTVEGYWIVTVIAHVQNETILDEFVQKIGAKVGLENWTPVEKEKLGVLHSLPISVVPDFVKGIQTMGQVNAELGKKLIDKPTGK